MTFELAGNDDTEERSRKSTLSPTIADISRRTAQYKLKGGRQYSSRGCIRQKYVLYVSSQRGRTRQVRPKDGAQIRKVQIGNAYNEVCHVPRGLHRAAIAGDGLPPPHLRVACFIDEAVCWVDWRYR